MRGLCQDGYEVKLTLGNSDILVAFALAGYVERKLVYLQRVFIKENILLEYAGLHGVIALLRSYQLKKLNEINKIKKGVGVSLFTFFIAVSSFRGEKKRTFHFYSIKCNKSQLKLFIIIQQKFFIQLCYLLYVQYTSCSDLTTNLYRPPAFSSISLTYPFRDPATIHFQSHNPSRRCHPSKVVVPASSTLLPLPSGLASSRPAF